MMFKPEVIKQKKGENRRSENSRNTRCAAVNRATALGNMPLNR